MTDKDFEKEIVANFDKLYYFAKQYVYKYDDVQDVFQTAMLKMSRFKGDFQYKSTFYTWACQTIMNAAKDLYEYNTASKRKGTATYDIYAEFANEEIHHLGAGVFNSLIVQEVAHSNMHCEHIDAVIKKTLKPEGYEMIKLYAEGYNYKELSRKYNISESNVAIRLTRAKRKLKKALI